MFVVTRIWEPVQCQTRTCVYVNAALELVHLRLEAEQFFCVCPIGGGMMLQWQHISAHCLEHHSHCVHLHLYCCARHH